MKKLSLNPKPLMGLLMLLTILFVMPQGAQAQTKYKIETDGNCEVYYYDNFERIVVTEAEAGKKLAIWLKEDAKSNSGQYFTGEYTLNGSSLGVASWGAYNDEFTMPAKAAKIVALQANRKSVTLDLTTTARQVIPAGAALQFNIDERVTPDYEIGGYDMDNSGVTDLIYFDEGGEDAYVQRLEGADASGTITLSYSGPKDSYGSISFVFPMKERIQLQSGWITLSHSSYEYDGTAKEPTVTVNDGAGDITTYFDITYNNNTNAGNAAQVTVTAMSSQAIYKGSVSKTFTITPKAINVAAESKSKKFGEADPKLTYTADALIGSDQFSGSLEREDGENVGTYKITQGSLSAGDNYSISFTGATFTINQAEMVTTAPTAKSDLEYNGGSQVLVKAGSSDHGTVLYSLDNINYTADLPQGIDAKEYTVYYKFENDANYSTADGGSLQVKIAPKPVTVTTGSATKEYDGTPLTNSEASITGLVPGEKATVIAKGSQTDVGSSPNTYEINWVTAKATNYKVSKEDLGTLTVTPAPEPDPVTENVIETNTETVTNLDGSTTTIVTSKETDSSGKLVKESNTSTTNFLDGSKKVSESKTPETDGKRVYVSEDGTVTGIDLGNSMLFGGVSRDNIVGIIQNSTQGSGESDAQPDILIAQGNESNVLVNKETEIDPQGEVTATSASLTVKQTGAAEDGTAAGPTRIAVYAGGDNGGGNGDAPTSGKFGHFTWEVSKSDANSTVYDVLTISGSGKMKDGSPWSAYKKQIKTVIFESARNKNGKMEGVTSIGESAFKGCSSLKSVTIPAGVTSIGESAFNGCSAMTSLTFAEGSQLQTIGDYAFYGLTSLTSDIILPASVTSMGQNAFASVSKNTTVGISITAAAGSQLTAIHTDAFIGANASIDLSNCSKLEAIGSDLVFSQVTGDVTLPSSVTSICQYAFENQYSYPYSGEHVYVVVPKGKKLKVTIAGVTDPVEVTHTNGKADIIDCLFANRAKRIASRALTLALTDASTGGEGGGDNGGGSENPDAPTSGTFGNLTWEVSKSDANSTVYDVLTISGSGEMNNGSPWDAYQNQIKTVIIGEGVTSIGNFAFYGCSSLKSVTIPAGVTSIGIRAFNGCSSLKSVTIPASVKSIGNETFSDCSAMTSLTFAEGSQLQTIGDCAFYGLTSLTSDIILPASVTSMGQDAFERVSKNTTVGISITAAAGSQLTAIDTYAFNGANASIDLSNCTQLEAIGSDLVFNQVTGDVTLPSSVTSICQYAFENQYSQPYPGKHVYVTVPSGKKLKVTIAGVTDPVEVTPTNGKADIIDCLFDDPSKRIASRALTLKIVDASTGGDNGGGSASGQGQEPSTREKNDRAAKTMIVNYEKEKTGSAGGNSSVVSSPEEVNSTAATAGSLEGEGGAGADPDLVKGDHNTGGTTAGSRAATAEEENDEIEIVSGQEYELLHDGYVVLNFYTAGGSITVNSIIIRSPGDANNDGYVNAADIVEMINAKDDKASKRFNLTNADIDRDGTITQRDIDFVVKLIMEPKDKGDE